MGSHALLDRLDGVRHVGSGWKAVCPAHEDRKPSLSVCERDGRVLIHCHAGCTTSDVLEALGLSWGSLFSGDDDE